MPNKCMMLFVKLIRSHTTSFKRLRPKLIRCGLVAGRADVARLSMNIFRTLVLIVSVALALWVLSSESQARVRKCSAPAEIINYCSRIICIGYGARSSCTNRCVWNVTAGDCWSRPQSP